jgi:hypothetical protein
MLGYILYQGVTGTGHPYVVVATMFTSNTKTGDMVQVWILLEDMPPYDAVKSGLDAETVCTDCPWASGNGCYVLTWREANQVWNSYKKGNYVYLEEDEYSVIFKHRRIRFGAYGNPTLLPIEKVALMAKSCKGWTGYYHNWRNLPDEWNQYFMASTETDESYDEAKARGLRVYHASPDKPELSVTCPYFTQGLRCMDCLLCDGKHKSSAKDVWHPVHGAFKKRAEQKIGKLNDNTIKS